MRLILLTTGVTLVAALGFMIDSQSRMPIPRRAEIPVEQYKIYAPGRVEGTTPEIELRPRLDGRIVKLPIRDGQLVEQGEILLQLDDQQYQHEVALAAARLDLAKAELKRLVNGAHDQERIEAVALCRAKQAELECAELAWKRIGELHESKAISDEAADNQRTQVAALKAEVEAARARQKLLEAPARDDEVQMANARIQAAKAQLELAKVRLERTKLRAPSSGRILKVEVEMGELSGPDSLRPAVILVDTSAFRVRAFVEELDAPRLKLGMTATVVADGLPNQQLKGRISRLSPRMSRKQLWSDRPTERYDTKTREVWLELEDAQELVVGLRVDVTIDACSLAVAPDSPSEPGSAEPDCPAVPKPPHIAQALVAEQ